MQSQSEVMADMILNFMNINLFVTKTVKELLTGYDDELLYSASIFDPDTVKSKQFSMLNGVKIYIFKIKYAFFTSN